MVTNLEQIKVSWHITSDQKEEDFLLGTWVTDNKKLKVWNKNSGTGKAGGIKWEFSWNDRNDKLHVMEIDLKKLIITLHKALIWGVCFINMQDKHPTFQNCGLG